MKHIYIYAYFPFMYVINKNIPFVLHIIYTNFQRYSIDNSQYFCCIEKQEPITHLSSCLFPNKNVDFKFLSVFFLHPQSYYLILHHMGCLTAYFSGCQRYILKNFLTHSYINFNPPPPLPAVVLT